jgi:intein-encoded DNA endonuclease-like protein
MDNKCIILELQKEMYTLPQINGAIEELRHIKDTKTLMNIWDTLNIDVCNTTKQVIAKRNGAVVNYFPTASVTLRCNTAAYHLGGNEQAKATLYYLIK